jgi:hypothetical protein
MERQVDRTARNFELLLLAEEGRPGTMETCI